MTRHQTSTEAVYALQQRNRRRSRESLERGLLMWIERQNQIKDALKQATKRERVLLRRVESVYARLISERIELLAQ